MSLTIVTAFLLAVGLVGIVVPVVPGLLLTLGATLLWSSQHQDSRAWWVFGIAVVLYAVGVVTQYLIPGRRMRTHGIGTSTLLLAAALGVIGFFVIPVVGALVGFVLGIYLVEFARSKQTAAAWTSTKIALRAVAHSMGIELLAGLAIIVTWVVGLTLLGQGA
ncbi:MAG: DUF456 domain-containing protein [Dermatophilaceae bacterium]|nr:DUF456 domain-containing protein [Actinomycetales bacterium]